MLSFLNIMSGSKGNATLLYDESTLFMIDMGASLKALKEGLRKINRTMEQIEACFITHEHYDHISGISYLLDNEIPVYCRENTPVDGANHFLDGEVFHLGSFWITPFPTSHDATDPCGYLITHDDESLFYMTDTGEIPEFALSLMKNHTYYIIESNHDLKTLLKSHRPTYLKQRIHGDHGHLSNMESVQYMKDCIGDKTKAIYLAHLSEECNTDELALNTYRDVLNENGIDLRKIKIVCLHQRSMTLGGDER